MVREPAGYHATGNLGRVHDGEQPIRHAAVHPLGYGVGCDVRRWNQAGKVDEEHCKDCQDEADIGKDGEVGVPFDIIGGGEAGAHESDSEDPHDQANEGDATDCPAESDLPLEVFEQERKDDATDGTCTRHHADGDSTIVEKPVSSRSKTGGPNTGASDASKNAKAQKELIVFLGDTDQLQ